MPSKYSFFPTTVRIWDQLLPDDVVTPGRLKNENAGVENAAWAKMQGWKMQEYPSCGWSAEPRM